MCSQQLSSEIMRVINGECKDPFSVLGIHKVNDEKKHKKILKCRVYMPNADTVILLDEYGAKYPMEKIHHQGFFEATITDKDDVFFYSLNVTDTVGNNFSTYDPYSFQPVLTDFDMYLFNQGNHNKIYEKLGARIMELNSVRGTFFAVWAPCAKRVSVIGNYNQWDGRRHQMRSRGSSGIWEIFIPGLLEKEIYKYEIRTPTGEIYQKADPYAFYAQMRPDTASVVYDLDKYQWNDDEWIAQRENSNIFSKPVSIYEMHLGSWKRRGEGDSDFYSYREIAHMIIPYIKDMGFTHIELMPISEHPFDGSWGYQLTGYYAATSRYGEPDDFMYFVDKCHENNIGVLVDWVPAHFPKDGHGLARFDGTALYEHEDMKQGEHPDWGTHIFNYGRHEVKNFLISNAIFWFDKYHIDGLRVDAVASMLYLDYAKNDGEWVPNKWGGKENIEAIDFMRQLNQDVYKYYNGVMMIAEESTSWSLVTKPPYVGGLGFSFKWNMGWMNDFLRYISMDPIYRRYHQGLLTFSMVYAYAENFVLVLSHDEVVHGKCSMISKMPGDYWQKFAGLRASYGFMFAHPGKKLLFMGGEFGQFTEWNYKKSLDWNLLEYDMHKKLQDYVRDLNQIYKSNKALHEVDFDFEGFEWIDCDDSDHSIISFIRKAKDWQDSMVIVCNFTPVVYHDYCIGIPFDTTYTEVFNSDNEKYGGSGVANLSELKAVEIPFHGKRYSIKISIPPLAMIMIKPKF